MEIFNNDVLLLHCDDNTVYQNEELFSSLNTVFALPELQGFINDQQAGGALSTCGFSHIRPIDFPGIQNLLKWIEDRIIESSEKYTNAPILDILYGRMWVNRMFKGCQGRIHIHGSDTLDFVSIFYIDVPEDSGSNLIFVKDGIQGHLLEKYSEEQKCYLSPKTGDLIIHSPFLPHGISTHNSDKPRTCLIVEGSFILGPIAQLVRAEDS